jgi:hypothetical protein
MAFAFESWKSIEGRQAPVHDLRAGRQQLANLPQKSSDRIACSGIESGASADEFQPAFPAMANHAYAGRSGCGTKLGIPNRPDSTAGAWRAPERQCRPSFPPPLPRLIVPTMAANS